MTDNSDSSSDNTGARMRQLVVLGLSFVILIVGAAVYISRSHQPAVPSPPASPGPASPSTRYSGDTELVNRGLLTDQVKAIEIALERYSTNPTEHTTFTNVQHAIDHTPEGEPIHSYSFTVKIDDVAYTAKALPVSDSAVRLYLYALSDPTKIVFDSTVDAK